MLLAPLHLRRRRVPVIRQQQVTDCGVACLAMVLGFFGCARPLARCRAACDLGRDGVTAATIGDAARALGLAVHGWMLDDPHALSGVLRDGPAIVHWQRTHFVVVERIGRHVVTIVDPAVGRRRIGRRRFEAGCSGVALTFEPSASFDPHACRRRSSGWRVLVDLLRGPQSWHLAALSGLMTIGVQVCGMVVPLAIYVVIDEMLSGGDELRWTWLAAAALLTAGALGLFRYVRGSAVLMLRARVETRFVQSFHSQVLRLPLPLLQRRSASDLAMCVAGLNTARELVTTKVVAAAVDGVLVVSVVMAMVWWSPRLAVLLIASLLLQVVLVVVMQPAMRRSVERQLVAQHECDVCVSDTLQAIAAVKATGTEDRVLSRWTRMRERERVLSEGRERVVGLCDAVLASVWMLTMIACLVLGASEVVAGRMGMALMGALAAMVAGALAACAAVVDGLRSCSVAFVQVARVRDLLEEPVEQETRVRPVKARVTGGLRVEGVSFRYQRLGPLVLEDVSFAVRAGDVVAIVGRSGAGKSTLARLLVGLHEPSAGRVLLDGWPLASLDYMRVRRRCGVVLQGDEVLNVTIRDNIAFGRPQVTFEDVVHAASVAGLHDDIVRMPMGYDTCVLEGGVGLSAGQRQRLLLARAVVHRPALLVLDEAMNHLDGATERRVDARLRTMACTRVIVAHRIATVQEADIVLVLERGRLVERGDHLSLLARGGLYAALADAQRIVRVAARA